RFAGAALCTLMVGLAGMLGSLAGTLVPGLEPERIAAFSLRPYVVCFAILVVPNLLVFCTIGFCVAVLTRTAVLSFAASLVLIVVALVLNTSVGPDARDWLAMLDPFGAL